MGWPSSTWRQKYVDQSYGFSKNSIIPPLEVTDRSSNWINDVATVSDGKKIVLLSDYSYCIWINILLLFLYFLGQVNLLKSALEAACSELIKSADELDDLDRKCGDGD